ncbi:MAG TPA: hypothetical protein VGD98_13695 [Ktedonobacteraceae bacterium]
MITQAIKNWFRKMFAWWPWKQSTPLEHQYVAGVRASRPVQETPFWTSKDGIVPQAGATPRRFTFESRGEPLAQPRSEMPDASSYPLPVVFRQTGAYPTGDSEEASPVAPNTPTSQQRLEFLRYLVQRGILNEGCENDPPTSLS